MYAVCWLCVLQHPLLKVLEIQSLVCLMTPQLVARNVSANCVPCMEAPKIYEELQCEGRTGRGDCCNTRYNCSTALGKLRDGSKCLLKGRLFEIGEKVALNSLPTCVRDATCTSSPDGPTFSFNREEIKAVPDGCLPQYNLENLCNPLKFVCGAEEQQKLLKCELRGKEYHEGQLFSHPAFSYFSAACYKCLCDATFDNMTIPSMNKNCRKFDCGIEVFHGDKIRNGCVPVHKTGSAFSNEPTECCPSNWICRKCFYLKLTWKTKRPYYYILQRIPIRIRPMSSIRTRYRATLEKNHFMVTAMS